MPLSDVSPAFSNSPAVPTPSNPGLHSVPAGGGNQSPLHQVPPGHHAPAGGAQQLPDTQQYQVLAQALRQERDRGGNLQRELEGLRNRTGEQEAILGRLRTAFAPEQPRVDPRAERRANAENQLDYYVQAALEAERAGKPMPLTANLAAQLFQWQIEQTEKEGQTAATLADLQAKLEAATNPNFQIDQRAYSVMDSQIMNAMSTIYGSGPEYQGQRAAQFKAVAAQVGTELKDLQKTDPGTWDEIRRDDRKIQRMVNYFVEQNLPPRARQILAQQQMENEPQTMEGLLGAFREAQTAYKDDPRQLARVTPQIRAEILAEMMASRRNNGRPRISGMYNGRR